MCRYTDRAESGGQEFSLASSQHAAGKMRRAKKMTLGGMKLEQRGTFLKPFRETHTADGQIRNINMNECIKSDLLVLFLTEKQLIFWTYLWEI